MRARPCCGGTIAFLRWIPLGVARPAAVKSPDAGVARLEAMAKTLPDAIDDERDYRHACEGWENHLRNETRLHTGKELKRHRSTVYDE